jgi:hypothetical protein
VYGFSYDEGLIGDSEYLALVVEYDERTSTFAVESYTPISAADPQSLDSQLSRQYIYSSDFSVIAERNAHVMPREAMEALQVQVAPVFLSLKKKYKPVAKKVKPVAATLPENFRIMRKIEGDPLASMPQLSPNPPPFVPTGRYTQERKQIIDKAHPPGFLWPAERALMHDFMRLQEQGFAWNDLERGRFRTDFFPPIQFPVIPHTPWIQKNFPIPPGLYEEVCGIIRKKMEAGVYEPSNSSYRSRWFCVLKKDGKSLRIVHSLEPLNAVTIKHSGVTPIPDHLAEQFAGRACGAMLDLYVGYDERPIAETSRDLTTFQTPYGAQRLVTLPMGWTNSVPIFHDDVTYILQPEIPDYTVPYIDDVPVKGPPSRYLLSDGSYETIPENPGIRRFVWEHFQNLNRIVQRMKYCGGTFSGYKLYLCVPEITVVGHLCTYEGRIPERSKVAVIRNWGPCKTLSEVRAFLGTAGLFRIFVKNFAHRAHALVKLTRKDVPFEFGSEQVAAQEDLKKAILESPALRPIDYHSKAPVILAVDTSYIAVGYYLCQCDSEDRRKRYYSRFGSITLNDREARFSQAKLEIYGLYRTLREIRIYLVGARNLVVEVDARYIKGMLNNPDIVPSASINRWIVAILTFHFELVHVPGSNHGPDGLSRRPPQPDDEEPQEDDGFDDWIDNLYGFVHQINSATAPAVVTTFAQILESNDPPSDQDEDYAQVPRSEGARADDEKLVRVTDWLKDPLRKNPIMIAEDKWSTFVKYATEFFIAETRLWRKDSQGAHRLVIFSGRRLAIMRSAHDGIGHKGFYATKTVITDRFWWPHMLADISWYVRTCHICQERQLRQVLIPPVVAIPAPVFGKIYVDTMHLPPSRSYKYLVQGRCSLTHYPEFRMLRSENAQTIGDWIFEDILCRWGALTDIVTDNGPAFVKAVGYLAKRYKINHIRISGYNSRANGIVERTHFDVRQSLYKAANGNPARWSQVTHSVFWAERITTRKRMGCSPYFAITGAHPVIPLDIVEATYLQTPPGSVLSTTDLIARRAIALQKRSEDISKIFSKVYLSRRRAALRFERTHAHTIRDFDFKRGNLVLMRNTAIEKSLNKKMRARYLGPLIVVARNRGGAYILAELDGSVLHRPIAAFRVIPYFARKTIKIPDNIWDIDEKCFNELIRTGDVDGEENARADENEQDKSDEESDEESL